MSDSNERSDDQGKSKNRGLFNIFGKRGRDQGLRDSIAALVHEASQPGDEPGDEPELDRQERALITNVLRLREITADDVMVPRADIIAMPGSISFEDALAMMRRENHSRLPVYREQLDDIAGMIHVKDLVAYVGDPEAFDLRTLLRQPLMIAPTIPVLDLLLQMRQRRMHMALVIDEYGGIDGLVTIEDLIETIVGDISDEHDDPVTIPWIERPDGSFDIDARLPVRQLEERLGAVLTDAEREAEIETVGGLVFRLAEHVPARDEVLTHETGLEFRVLDADARHIRSLRMRVPHDWEKRPIPTLNGQDEDHGS
ncbi:hemolysin family protein [Gluconobacter wancherniae]|uniref:Hemolysin C n=2 Tax=Gluconobacter wancherniae TaxID=1307955 RepID=A0A511AXD7_9PROT|nr:hemolysin family protein [Gluconobacter wancherniae]MBF0853053.1 HlyC/CorC family transporter [Gluconobacter wancherniae]MBS1061602.1 HlyC/CorC family transporter [Gluconobacter wancherniae]MBS1087940.1 HlyC/CorC family transporter [Gluconobacter wancherniae]MBS1093633.1 HlyC/CorC family transporter [Gluconobacter wancherniae]GBD56230.1 hemolysin C [Gluconobacter wancherniae NBRC 103581]